MTAKSSTHELGDARGVMWSVHDGLRSSVRVSVLSLRRTARFCFGSISADPARLNARQLDPTKLTKLLHCRELPGRAKERTRYRGRALRAGWSLWLGARHGVELEGMTG